MTKRTPAARALALLATACLAWTAAPVAQAATAPAHRAVPAPSHQAGAAPSAAAARQASLRVEPLGDSITWGVGSSSGNGYRGPLGAELTGEGYTLDFVGSGRGGTMSDPDNEGHSGWRIDQIAGIADSSLAAYKPNVVTLMIGTNDLGQGYQVPTAPDRLRALVDQVTADAPAATVLLADLTVSTSPQVARDEPAYNAAVQDVARAEQAAGKRVVFVDMGALTAADLSDPLHPSDAGYQKMADAWNKGVQSADAAGWLQPPPSVTGPIRSGLAGKCLDVNGGSSADGAAVQIWGCNSTPAQAWTVAQDGTLRAVGKCLDATGAGTANGTKVEIWDCNGGGNQQWQPYDGGFRNPVSGRCLDDPALSTADGTQTELWDCNGGPNQQWALG
ncbi:ricin-type beta-trefoil lectin domain protein [Streptomyces sp. NPDC046985]|uniref:ricin-type beta-trefoil lectin domain protein n=1 Tax=Streptomyces sp. NPDC046985 TaxID=3155377 RepID=UPI003403593C